MNKILFVLLGVLVLSGAIVSFLGVMIADEVAETLRVRHERILNEI